MTKPPKKKPPRKRNALRNGVARPASAPTRPTRSLVRERAATANGDSGTSPNKSSWGTETLKTAGGAAGAALACAYIARENWIPPLFVTGLLSAVGGTLATLGRNETLRNVGTGVMAGAGSQALLMLIDSHYDSLETQKRIVAAQAEKAAADKAKAEHAKADASKTTRSADSLPPGALEAAYGRARARLAMAQAASQMAA
jgi:hypothetical protein